MHTKEPDIVFSEGAESQVARLLVDRGAQRVLLVATARHREGADRIASALANRCVGVWADAVAQVPRETADALVARVKETGADWLVAHGGGTTIGAAKAAALRSDIQIACVPTTYSGSEMTSIWGLTEDGVKTTGRDPRVQPSLVVYDPDLYAALPVAVAHSSLFNALAHSVDALFDASADDAVHDDAEASILAILAGLRGLHPDRSDARAQAVRGAYLAGKVLGRATMALHHKLAHVLGGSFGTPHAQTHAILLPFTLAHNQGSAPVARVRLERAFGAQDPAAAVFDLATSLGMPTRLSSVGFAREQVSRAVSLAVRKQYANPRPVTETGLTTLLTNAVLGRRPSEDNLAIGLDGVGGVHGGLHATVHGDLERAERVLVAIHGRGSTADAFVERLSSHLDGSIAIVAPQASENTWYPKGFRAVQDNAAHLESALAAMDAAFELATARAASVHVVGFSQGACLALTWLASRRERARPASLLAFSGAVIPGHSPASLEGVDVYLGIAGSAWVALTDVHSTQAVLQEAGANVVLETTPGDDHTIHAADFAALSRHLETL
ncbi:MAG: maleylacetate reductase [Myxococcota bacterium]